MVQFSDDNLFNNELTQINLKKGKHLLENSPNGNKKKLYHYTNASGLIGVLSTDSLWATDFRFLNDSSELNYGFKLYTSLLKEKLNDETDPFISELISRCMKHQLPFGAFINCYITCFCEDGDLLSQWREYASSGGGFAIEFDSDKFFLTEAYLRSSQRPYLLLRVIYDETEQRKILADIIDSVITLLKKQGIKHSSDTRIADACGFLNNVILDYLLIFKHPSFSVEKEWRLVTFLNSNNTEKINFRNGKYGLTPYTVITPRVFGGPWNEKLPISKITHGPTLEPSITRSALDLALDKYRYAFTELDGSLLPIR